MMFDLNDELKLSLAKVGDLSEIIEIYNQNVSSKQVTADLVPVTKADKQAWFEVHLNNPQRPIYVVKDQHQKLVAWASFSDMYQRPAYHISSEISIYIHQAYQGQGLGKALLDFMLGQTSELGIYNVVALIFAHNQPSLALFDKFGFQQWGYLPQVCDMSEFLADVVIMGKAIKNDNYN